MTQGARAEVTAVSIAPAAQRWLDTSESAAVLHSFRQACNLTNSEGEVLGIVNGRERMGPFSVALAMTGDGWPEHLPTSTAIRLSPQLLSVGSLRIDLTGASVWVARPPWERLGSRHDRLMAGLEAIEAALPSIATAAEALELWLPRAARATLTEGLASGEDEMALTAAQSLAGRGPGLTPAGDDFVLGSILAVWAVMPVPGPLPARLASAAVPRTCCLSAAWLRAAGRGEASHPWHLLAAALESGDPAAIGLASLGVLNLGHTSGVATLDGFVRAARALIPCDRSSPGGLS